jgi:hypothetical protein
MRNENPPPHERQPLIGPPENCCRILHNILTVIKQPACFIPVFCVGGIIILVILIVVFGRARNPVETTTTITTATTITTTSTTTTITTTIRSGQAK